MKERLITLGILLGISLFCGTIFFAVGMGSIFPKVNQISRPIVCGSDKMEIVQHVDHYLPGQTNWSITAYCINGNNYAKREVTNSVFLVSGLIYSLIPMIIFLGLWLKFRSITPDQPQSDSKYVLTPEKANDYFETRKPSSRQPKHTHEQKSSESVEEKLKKLKQLHESNLITDEDYQKKKEKILDNL